MVRSARRSWRWNDRFRIARWGWRPPHLRLGIGWRGDNPARPSQIGAASPARRRDGRMSGPLYAARRLPGRVRIEGRACQCAGRRHANVRILTGNVGGSFGMNSQVYPEYFDLFNAAKALGRPIKWTDERGENVVSDRHVRDHEMTPRAGARRRRQPSRGLISSRCLGPWRRFR
jgi:Molybdopterin-binding domain of aldehyde dehydrogenase